MRRLRELSWGVLFLDGREMGERGAGVDLFFFFASWRGAFLEELQGAGMEAACAFQEAIFEVASVLTDGSRACLGGVGRTQAVSVQASRRGFPGTFSSKFHASQCIGLFCYARRVVREKRLAAYTRGASVRILGTEKIWLCHLKNRARCCQAASSQVVHIVPFRQEGVAGRGRCGVAVLL